MNLVIKEFIMSKHKNRERLERAQECTTQNVNKYLSTHSGAKADLEASFAKLDASNAKRSLNLDTNSLATLISKLEIIRDGEHGISTWNMENKDGTYDLVRDARFASQPNQDSNTSRLISCLNYARGVQRIINEEVETDQRTHYQGLLNNHINTVIEKYKKGEKIDTKEFNTELYSILHSAGIHGDIPKKITAISELLSLEDQQYHVSTITSATTSDGSTKYIVESDNMMLGITSAQLVQFKEIKRIGDNPQEIARLGSRYDWYKKLSHTQQKIILENIDKLIEGRVIPTQLRKILPGIRNAHAKTTSGYDPETKQMITIQETMHTGTVSFHGNGNKQEVATNNVAQLQTFAPEDKKVNLNILNSPANPTGIDKAIVKQARNAVKKLGGILSNTPFNWFRLISGNDNRGFESTLEKLGEALKQKGAHYGDISSYLKTGKNEKKAKDELDKIQDPKVKRALEHAMRAKKLMTSFHFIYDPKNSNLALVSEMKRLEFEMRKGALRQELGKDVCQEIINTLCASGKDRTGAAETETTRKAVNDYLGYDIDHVHRENFERQVAGQHTQVIASVNGGSRGCHGIKSETHRSLPTDPYHEVPGLYQKSSSFNSFKYDKTRIRILKFFAAVESLLGGAAYREDTPPSKAKPAQRVRNDSKSTVRSKAWEAHVSQKRNSASKQGGAGIPH
jgi:hypothetical protein